MRILIVETDVRIRTFLARGMETEGFFVDVTGTGREGIALALARDYDLILLDVPLPDIEPPGALTMLHRRIPEVPVMVLSDLADLPTKLRAFELGAVDYVPKPFAFAELLARVRVQLARTRGSGVNGGNVVLHAGELTLDVAGHRAGMGSTVADLPDREFRLLHFLMLHRGHAMTRERLLSEVWGCDFAPGSNMVDVCVRRLRRRLGPDAPIETVRDVGYRLTV